MMKNSRYALTAIGLGAVLLLGTGCSATTPAAPISSEAGSSESKPSIAGTVVNGIPTKPELAFDGKGKYVQTTLASDDPANTWDPAITTPRASHYWTVEEMQDGQKVAAKFVAEEVLDSEINDNPGSHEVIERWVSKNGDKIGAAARQAFIESLYVPEANKEDFLFRGTHRQGKYELVSGETQTRIASRTITLTALRGDLIEGREYVEYEFDVNTVYNAKVDGRDAQEVVTGKFQLILGKNATTNQWEISGANNTFQVTPAE